MRSVTLQFSGYDQVASEEWTHTEQAVMITERVAVVSDNWENVWFYIFDEPVVGDTADGEKADSILFNTQGVELTTEMAAMVFHDFARFVE